MQIVFTNFAWGLDSAECSCWIHKDNTLEHIGDIKAPDGDSLAVACADIERAGPARAVSDYFGENKIFVAP